MINTSKPQKEKLRAHNSRKYTLNILPHRFTKEQIIKILEPLDINEFYKKICDLNLKEYSNNVKTTKKQSEAFLDFCNAWSWFMASSIIARKKDNKTEYDTFLKAAIASYLIETPTVAESLRIPERYFYREHIDGSVNFEDPKI